MITTLPRRITRISRTALVVVLATGAVGVLSSLTACGAEDSGSSSSSSRRTSRSNTAKSSSDTADNGSGAAAAANNKANAGTSASPTGDTASTSTSNSGSAGDQTPSSETPASTAVPNMPSGNPPNMPPSTPPNMPPSSGGQGFDIALATPTAKVNIQDTTTLQLTIAPKGFVGDVALSVTGLPTGATGEFSTPKVAVTATAGGTATLTVKSGSAPPGSAPFKVVAKAGEISKESPATLTVEPKFVIKLPDGANTNANNFGTIPLQKGAGNLTVVWENPTNQAVTIHRGNAGAGMTHGGSIAPGASESRTVTATGKFIFYVHNNKADQANPGFLDVK
jgi:hypothetical protein